MRTPRLLIAGALALGLSAALTASDPSPLIRGHFDLRDARSGREVTQASYAGRTRLVFFGFTHCPLTCPVGLHTLAQVLTRLGQDAGRFQCLFITLDPERDDAATVAAYLDAFDPRITGLVGSPSAIHAAMRDFRLEAERIDQAGGYTLDHPAIFYVMGPQGAYLRTLSSRGDPAQLARQLRALLKQ